MEWRCPEVLWPSFWYIWVILILTLRDWEDTYSSLSCGDKQKQGHDPVQIQTTAEEMLDVETVERRELKNLYICSFDVLTTKYTVFDFFHNKLTKIITESFIQHNINWKYLYLFQWLNIYSSEHRSSKHPVCYSISI